MSPFLVAMPVFILLLGTVPVHALYNDKIETLWAWDNDIVNVTLVTSYTIDQLEEITKAVTSEEFYMIEDNLMHKDRPGIYSPYYLGWQGALNNANATTPQLNFQVGTGGDIVLELTNLHHPKGFSGLTTQVLDKDGKVSKVQITIFDVDKISNAMLYTIVLHEMGHALGIGHTTADEELMYPVITTAYPYVSPCTMQALEFAYTEGKGQVTCLK
jgi:hypothetical protein